MALLGHLGGILVSLALLFGGCGFALFLLRNSFKKNVEATLPKKKGKVAKTKVATAKASIPVAPAPAVTDVKPELDTSVVAEQAQTSEPKAEFNFALDSQSSSELSSEISVPQLLAPSLSQNESAPLAASPSVSDVIPVPPEAPAVPELPVNLSNATQKRESHATVPSHRAYQVTSIHVAIWPYDRVLERLNPDHAYEALNEFHGIGVSWAEKNKVIYERCSGASFYLHWTDEAKAADALKITLELRQEFMEWNDVRRAQGYPPFMVVMGADLGLAIWCMIGPDGYRRESVVGEVTARARALSQISLALGTNLLASDTLWSSVTGRYLGEKVASATLTAFKNLTACYKVQGYYDEQGKEVWMRGSDHDLDPESCQADAPKIEKSEPTKLWRVNNGSQILGPMSAKDVGRALYSLDLDFDCECWEEKGYNRVTIEKSGMFGGVADDHACFWVFDGDALHGPLTEEFLKTGMGKKVFPRDSYVCEKSTLNGWKPLMELRASLNAVASEPAAIETPEAVVAQSEPVAPPAPMLQDITSFEPSELAPLAPEAPEPVLSAIEPAVEVEEEEPTDNIDISAFAASASAIAPEPPAAPVISLELRTVPETLEMPEPPVAPEPHAAPSLETLAGTVLSFEPPAPPLAPVADASFVMPEPPEAPVLVQMPEPPAPPAPPALEQAPVAEAAPAPAIEMPILMPVLEAIERPRKSA